MNTETRTSRRLSLRWRTPGLARRRQISIALGALLSLSMPLVGHAGSVPTAVISIVQTFDSETGNGPVMTGMLAEGDNGEIHGVLPAGGAFGGGTAFAVEDGQSFSVTRDFKPYRGGISSGLASGPDSSFYGASNRGVFKLGPEGRTLELIGAFPGRRYKALTPPVFVNNQWYGVVEGITSGLSFLYVVNDSGTTDTVWAFDPSKEGTQINALILGNDGRLYGTARSGGQFGCGTVFKINLEFPPAKIRVLHQFQNVDGCSPRGPLAQGPDGSLFGVTYAGGSFNSGTVFRITTTGATFQSLHAFNRNALGRGAFPTTGLLLASDGLMYGGTYVGGSGEGLCGVLFAVDPVTGRYRVATELYLPLSSIEACHASSALFQHSSGMLYGMTAKASPTDGNGVLYALDVYAPPFNVGSPTRVPLEGQ